MEASRPADEGAFDERSALLPNRHENHSRPSDHRVPASIARRLYVSHFLSTWNSRVFEFGAVLYLAAIFPGTLLPMSVYALFRGLSAIVFAPAVGLYIDTGDRLQVVRVSIVFQRLVVAGSCIVFYILGRDILSSRGAKSGMLVLLTLFACVEKLCSIMNMVSVEKDWVVVVAERDQEALRVLNAEMRRIDLLCKLFGPLFIALIDGYSSEVAILVNFGMNATSVVIEYFAIAKVYYDVPELQVPKQSDTSASPDVHLPKSDSSFVLDFPQRICSMGKKFVQDIRLYFGHRAFLPSFAGAVLYLTVLSFAGIARTLSVAFEVLATWVAPWLMGWVGVVRAGLWLSSLQTITLVAGLVVFWVFDSNPVVSASGLVGGTILSRLGLRGFDLCTQFIVQEEVEAENRGAFSSTEAAWQNAFELLSFVSTIAFSRPDQFKWPSLVSVVAVASASMAYTTFVYIRRGHLLHLEVVTKLFVGRKSIEDYHGGISSV
ncbi:hypothetical protein ACJ41O_000054 [Fusarium nematophilum]